MRQAPPTAHFPTPSLHRPHWGAGLQGQGHVYTLSDPARVSKWTLVVSTLNETHQGGVFWDTLTPEVSSL